MKKISALYFIICLCSCSGSHGDILAGTYANAKNNELQLAWAQLNGITSPAFDTLQLKTDSTCVFRNCSMSASGHWKLKRDTVFVYYENKHFNIDSLNTDPKYIQYLRGDTLPLKYVVQGNSLTSTIKLADGGLYKSEMIKQ